MLMWWSWRQIGGSVPDYSCLEIGFYSFQTCKELCCHHSPTNNNNFNLAIYAVIKVLIATIMLY